MTEYAKGLEGVIANESALSNVKGAEGRLSYLGYHIDDLVENCCYEEVVYLLHRGTTPQAGRTRRLRVASSAPSAASRRRDRVPQATPRRTPTRWMSLRTGVSMLGLYDKRATIGEPDLDEGRRHRALDLRQDPAHRRRLPPFPPGPRTARRSAAISAKPRISST